MSDKKSNVLISIRDLTKTYGTGKNQNCILNHISAEVYENDFTVIMGPSGAGKSTFLYVVSGMETCSGGMVKYKNQDITMLREKDMAALRTSEFGFVFQQANLVSNLTLEENILVSGYMKKGNKEKDVKKSCRILMEQMNITHAGMRMPSECSGGEAQRTAVARAVINKPAVVFADEPTGALNKNNTTEVLNLLGKLHQDGQSIMMVTHDVHAAIRGNRILYLEDGQIKGEIRLPIYAQEQERERQEQLAQWLSALGW